MKQKLHRTGGCASIHRPTFPEKNSPTFQLDLFVSNILPTAALPLAFRYFHFINKTSDLMEKIDLFRLPKRLLRVVATFALFAGLFLFAGIGQAGAQVSSAVDAASPYGGKTFVSESEALTALQAKLPLLYSQLNALTPETKPYKRKLLEVLCYKGIISDINGGSSVQTAYEGRLGEFAGALNLSDSADISFLRSAQPPLFDLLTN